MSLFLAGLLVRGGALTPEAVEEALQRLAKQGGTLDTNLLELGAAAEETLALYLSRASGLPVAPMEQLEAPPAELKKLLPLRLAERHGVVPFANEEKEVHLACVHPMEASHLDELALLLSQRIVAYVAPEVWIRQAIARLFEEPIPPRFDELLHLLRRERGSGGQPEATHSSEARRAEPAQSAQIVGMTPGPFRSERAASVIAAAPSPPSASAAPEPEPEPEPLGAASLGEALERATPGPVLAPVPAAEPKARLTPVANKAPRAEAPRVEAPRVEAPRAESPRVEAPRVESPRVEAPRVEAPRVEAPASAGRMKKAGTKPRSSLKLTMEDALAWLASAGGMAEALDILLRFTINHFPFAATLVVQRGRLVGFDAWGEGVEDPDRIRSLELSQDPSSVLGMVSETGGRYLGPLPEGDPAERIALHLGLAPQASALIQPISIAGRTVALLYVESEKGAAVSSHADLVMQVAQSVGRKLEQLIHARKAAAAITPRPLGDPSEKSASDAAPADTALRAMGSEGARPSPKAAAVPRLVALDLSPLERLAAGSKGVESLLAARTEEELHAAAAALEPFGGVAAALLVSLLPGEGSRRARGLSGTHRVIAALEVLGEEALPALRLAAASPSPHIRYEVARLIHRLKRSGMDPTLVVLSSDEDPKVAAAAKGEPQPILQPKAVR